MRVVVQCTPCVSFTLLLVVSHTCFCNCPPFLHHRLCNIAECAEKPVCQGRQALPELQKLTKTCQSRVVCMCTLRLWHAPRVHLLTNENLKWDLPCDASCTDLVPLGAA